MEGRPTAPIIARVSRRIEFFFSLCLQCVCILRLLDFLYMSVLCNWDFYLETYRKWRFFLIFDAQTTRKEMKRKLGLSLCNVHIPSWILKTRYFENPVIVKCKHRTKHKVRSPIDCIVCNAFLHLSLNTARIVVHTFLKDSQGMILGAGDLNSSEWWFIRPYHYMQSAWPARCQQVLIGTAQTV